MIFILLLFGVCPLTLAADQGEELSPDPQQLENASSTLASLSKGLSGMPRLPQLDQKIILPERDPKSLEEETVS